MNISQVLTIIAQKFPARTALICGDERRTYKDFNLRVNQLAHALLRLGMRKGDKVAVLFYNSIPFVEAYFAAIKAGGVFVPVNFRFVGEEAAYILNNSDSRFFFFGDEFSGLVQTIRSTLPCEQRNPADSFHSQLIFTLCLTKVLANTKNCTL